MTRQRHLVAPVALTGLSLLVFPLIEVAFTSTPFRIGDPIWRFGVEGVISGMMFFPMLGLLLLLAAAAIAESRVGNRAVMVVGFCGAVAIALLCAAFILDVLQVKATAAPRMYPAMKRAAISALMRDALAFAGFLTCGLAARRALRSTGHTPGPDRAKPIIVSQSTRAD